MRRVLLGFVAVGCLLFSVDASAYRTEKPQPFSRWDCPSFTRLNNFLSEIWNITNGRYNLDSITSNPNGVRNGTRGELVYAFFSNDEYICVNSSSPSPGTAWTCVNITTFGTLCGGTIDGAVLYDNGGVCGEDEGFTFTDSTNLVNINEATDGDSTLLELNNDLANTAGSQNERALLRFGFGSDSDAGIIAVGKLADYTSESARDSRMQFYVDQNGTALEVVRLTEVGVGIRTASDNVNVLDVEGNSSIGASYSGSGGAVAPSNGLIVQGQTGIGTSGTPSILGELTAGDSASQAAIYIRGGTGVSSPAQLFLTDNADDDVTSVAFTNGSGGTFPLTGKVLELNFDTGLNGMFLFNTEDNSSSSSFAGEPHGIVVAGTTVAAGITTRNINLSSGTSFANLRYNTLMAPTLIGVAGGAAEGATNAATLYIDNAPIAGTDATITSPYAIWVDAGAVRFDGEVVYNSTVNLATATVTGQIVTGGSGVSVSSCGSSPSVTGNDNAGKITVGGGVTTSCTLTFNGTSTNAPACTVSGNNTAVTYIATTTTSAMTLTSSADMQSDVVSYICLRY